MTDSLRPYAQLPIRLLFGFSFMYYGLPKIFDAQTHGFVRGMLTEIGVPAPDFMTYMVGCVETLGGLALLAGAFVPYASLALLPVMLVGMFTVHLPNGFSFMNITGMTNTGPQFGVPGYEVNLLYITALLSLVVLGGGKYSLESYFRSNSRDSDIVQTSRSADHQSVSV